MADPVSPTPMVLLNLGGSWKSGDKTSCGNNPLIDAARALQTICAHAEKWNIDRKQTGATGSSVGAYTSLWLALHADLANPTSNDPAEKGFRNLGPSSNRGLD